MNTNTARIRRHALTIAPLVIALAGFGAPAAQAAPTATGLSNPISVTRLAGPAQIAVVDSNSIDSTSTKPVVKKSANKAAAKKSVTKPVVKKTAVKKTGVKKTVKKSASKRVSAPVRSAK